ncbi:unnamed protein product [Darwinula stevensoni]|uniref:Ammonium transporter AmtB-like domain-containing protein n=1 Tax=Darwinula stevensoni TaxID=69355 RepID=A0A7R8X0N9_9CRUS|nr:unnamed protein product [Darwinula stevensoni]CAG0881413.1 unnamed protein product [Darwinula stevensoni]
MTEAIGTREQVCEADLMKFLVLGTIMEPVVETMEKSNCLTFLISAFWREAMMEVCSKVEAVMVTGEVKSAGEWGNPNLVARILDWEAIRKLENRVIIRGSNRSESSGNAMNESSDHAMNESTGGSALDSAVTPAGPIYTEENGPWNDVTWILTSAFLIFTMQSGYGLVESGVVSRKNEINIQVKNGANLALGGVSYWMFGYALSFGTAAGSNPFATWGKMGDFFVNAESSATGFVYSRFLLFLERLRVASAMAERCKFSAYCLFSFFNVLVYCIPAGWVWGEEGFLNTLGVVDIGGSGAVHLSGAVRPLPLPRMKRIRSHAQFSCSQIAGMVGTWMLGPRIGRYEHGYGPLPMGNPTNTLMGLFMLWWGWLGFNAGSTFGISGNKWKYACKYANVTLLLTHLRKKEKRLHLKICFIRRKGMYDIYDLVDGILASLVSISAASPLVHPWEAILIGGMGTTLTLFAVPLIDRLRLDDPVHCVAVHGVAGIWGLIVAGLFPERDKLVGYTKGRAGLFRSGDFTLLGLQLLAVVSIIAWSAISSIILLIIIDKTVGLRASTADELVGPDYTDHMIRHEGNEDFIAWHDQYTKDMKLRRESLRPKQTNVTASASWRRFLR